MASITILAVLASTINVTSVYGILSGCRKDHLNTSWVSYFFTGCLVRHEYS